MTTGEARKFIAAYIVGEAVTKENLEAAWQILQNSEPSYPDFLEEECGMTLEPCSLCDIFAERVAEYCELSPDERKREMGELAEHVQSCKECQEVEREMVAATPIWIAAAAAAGFRKLIELARPLRLFIEWSGAVDVLGPGIEVPRVARQMDVTTLDGTLSSEAKREIDLDAERNLKLRISIDGQHRGKSVELRFELREGDEKIDASAVRIQWSEAGTNKLREGRLNEFELHPLTLGHGDWTIRLISDDATEWVIPLTVERKEENL